MADQDAKDINQMMSANAEVGVAAPKKSKFIWVVLACVILGVGLGVVVYQQSLQSTVPTVTPRPTAVVSQTPAPTITPPVVPDVSVVVPVENKLTFPKQGKLRIYSNLSGIQMVMRITAGGTANTITLPARTTSGVIPMYSSDSTFEVTAGSVGTIEAFLNNTSGEKMRGWVNATDQKKCGANGFTVVDLANELAFVQSKLAGESIFAYQCWEDADDPGEFNDFYLLWTYVPGVAGSPSPSPTQSPSPTLIPSPTPTPTPTPTPKPSAIGSATPTPAPTILANSSATPTGSPRVTMPDTSEGTPVSGVFEVTVGTISIGILLLILGLFGLLAL